MISIYNYSSGEWSEYIEADIIKDDDDYFPYSINGNIYTKFDIVFKDPKDEKMLERENIIKGIIE